MTKEDLTFTAPFELEVIRQDYVHAFISWFNIGFEMNTRVPSEAKQGTHKVPVTFSTGPYSKYTHWKQTVFYLREVIAVQQGETIQGQLVCAPNKKNARDLDIEISYQFDGSTGQVSEDLRYKM